MLTEVQNRPCYNFDKQGCGATCPENKVKAIQGIAHSALNENPNTPLGIAPSLSEKRTMPLFLSTGNEQPLLEEEERPQTTSTQSTVCSIAGPLFGLVPPLDSAENRLLRSYFTTPSELRSRNTPRERKIELVKSYLTEHNLGWQGSRQFVRLSSRLFNNKLNTSVPSGRLYKLSCAVSNDAKQKLLAKYNVQ